MNRAMNDYKRAQQQQLEIKARIIKLRKEEEKAQKRIRDNERKKKLMQDMLELKQQKLKVIQDHKMAQKNQEDENRKTIHQAKVANKFVINKNKTTIAVNNRHIRQQIKVEQNKI